MRMRMKWDFWLIDGFGLLVLCEATQNPRVGEDKLS